MNSKRKRVADAPCESTDRRPPVKLLGKVVAQEEQRVSDHENRHLHDEECRDEGLPGVDAVAFAGDVNDL